MTSPPSVEHIVRFSCYTNTQTQNQFIMSSSLETLPSKLQTSPLLWFLLEIFYRFLSLSLGFVHSILFIKIGDMDFFSCHFSLTRFEYVYFGCFWNSHKMVQQFVTFLSFNCELKWFTTIHMSYHWQWKTKLDHH